MGGGSKSVVDGAEDVRDDYVEVGYLAVGLLSRGGNQKKGGIFLDIQDTCGWKSIYLVVELYRQHS